MNLTELRNILLTEPNGELNISLPDQSSVAAHFHLTEIGIETKQFIDCGGTEREQSRALLQILVSTDTDHRFSTEKLIRIIDRALKSMPSLAGDEAKKGAPQVEFELTGNQTIERYTLRSVLPGFNFLLTPQVTACLAPDVCSSSNDLSTSLPATSASACCSSEGCC